MMPELDDQELQRLINQPQAFADADRFDRKVMRTLSLRLMWRNAVIGLAGLVGGIYALGQFVRLPLSDTGPSPASEPGLVTASVSAEQTVFQGLKLFDAVTKRISEGLEWANRSIDFMHQPAFFWGSFAICVTLLVLYFAQSQEEVF
jgi:hypothetical protein